MNVIDYIASFFPLAATDKARLAEFDQNGSHIYVAAFVRWHWAYNEETNEYNSIRVTTQIQHEELTIYDDRSPEYQGLLNRIDLAEGRYLDIMSALPDQALYVGMCYVRQDFTAHIDDIFLVLPVKEEEEAPVTC